MSKPRILIVDDEPDICELLSITMSRWGYDTSSAHSVNEAKQTLSRLSPNLCLTDMRLPDGSGLDLIQHLNQQHPELPVAMMTAHGNIDTAVEALKSGAFDFISKPLEMSKLQQIVRDGLGVHTTSKSQQQPVSRLTGHAPAMNELRSTIGKLARSQAPVFIHGESGTGKEVVARSIHELSPRHDQAFIPVNCGAISSELMESEFFGHVKGSFTGANQNKIGLFEAADGGTLFLDEIAELPLSMQVKLLRAIQERAIRPVGATAEKTVNVRILSASHQHLQTGVDSGRFRQDLYFRLNVIEVHVPPLRERMSDLPELADTLLKKIAQRWGAQTTPKLSLDALERLSQHPFPGNVRELENILERAMALCDGQNIQAQDLQLVTAKPTSPQANLPQQQQHQEREAILHALEHHQWNRTAAAKSLGLTLRQLRYRLDKMGIK